MKRKAETQGSRSTKKVRRETQDQKMRRIAKKQYLLLANKAVTVNSSATTGALINDLGTVFNLLGNLSRGDNSLNNFSGDSIQPLSFKLRYGVLGNDQPQTMRVIVFQWFQSDTPAPQAILDTSGSLLGTPLAPFADRQFDNRKQHKILYDKIHGLTNTGAGDSGIYETAEVFLPAVAFKRIEFVYNSAVTQTGGIYMLVISDSAAVAHPSIHWVSEIIFSDH